MAESVERARPADTVEEVKAKIGMDPRSSTVTRARFSTSTGQGTISATPANPPSAMKILRRNRMR